MDAPLLRLPPEMVDNIAEILLEKDLLNFRLVCNEVESATFACFRRTCFTSRTVSLQLDSLETLVFISTHPRELGSRLETLRFDLRLLREYGSSPLDFVVKHVENRSNFHPLHDPHNRPIQEYRKKLQNLATDQAAATFGGSDAVFLKAALDRLNALKCIHIGRYQDARNRQIDREWTTSGVARLFFGRESVRAKKAMFYPKNYESDGISKILSAVLITARSLQTLSINKGFNFSREMTEIPAYHLRTFGNGLGEVRNLKLYTHVSEDDNDDEGTEWLARFLSLMPKIEDLDISLSFSEAAFYMVASQDFSSGLRYCALSLFNCLAEELYSFLEKHIGSLEHVSFVVADLEEGNWLPIFYLLSRSRLLKNLTIRSCAPRVIPCEAPRFGFVGTTEDISELLQDFTL